MDVLITYDVSSKSSFFGTDRDDLNFKVKKGMIDKGYAPTFIRGDKKTRVYLPNTTLWKEDTSPQQAKKDLLSVAENCDADILRLIAVEFTDNYDCIEGEPF